MMALKANEIGEPAAWYAVSTRSRHERVVGQLLGEKGVQVFLPEREVWSRRRDRRLRVSVPLFPGYLFAGVGQVEDGLRQLKWTHGVVRILGANGSPIPVSHRVIETLHTMVTSGKELLPLPYLVPGTRVRVTDGPLMGTEGTVLRRGRKDHFVVSVDLLQRSVAVELAEFSLEKIGKR